MRLHPRLAVGWLLTLGISAITLADDPEIVAWPDKYRPLTEPPCSYCSTQHRKGLVKADDRVLAWLRGTHNGGCFPLRHFIAGPRVINDTYGLFFYDPDGGYLSGFKKDYGYQFHGFRKGVMIVRGRDGTLWSALTGRGIDGPQKGRRLERIACLTTTWGYWLMLHPESTAYDLFDGKRYSPVDLPMTQSSEAKQTMGAVDTRLPALAAVLGVEVGDFTKAFVLDGLPERVCFMDQVGDQPITVFWYGPTASATAFRPVVDGRKLTFQADRIAPETAPFKDRETGTRWSLAGRGIDGPLRGKELAWVSSLQCRWYAWSAEFPKTEFVIKLTPSAVQSQPPPRPSGNGLLVSARQVLAGEVGAQLRLLGLQRVALELGAGDAAGRRAEDAAIQQLLASRVPFDYWIEVGRCPELADRQPAWMSSLQGHPEWRRFFPLSGNPALAR